MTRIVGIDLGTTYSLCAVFEDGRPRLVPNVHGEVLTPSVVGVLEDGRVVVGAAAKELRVTQPQRCAWCFKRWMGTDRATTLGSRTFTAPELSSLVLRSLKDDAEAQLHESIGEAVVTVPAYFNDRQRKATKLAGELAGLTVRRIVNEPTAAALAYGFHDRGASKKLIVIDLGGGTFDVTAMEIFEGTLEIVSTAGESFLGGEDFTDRLLAATLERQGRQLETAELKSPLLVARLRQECEQAKRTLTSAVEATIRLPDERGELAAGHAAVTVTRTDFDRCVTSLVERLTAPIAKAVRDARTAPSEFGDVILVGGATRMPAVRRHVTGLFQREPLSSLNPDEVVALGAAVQAALIADDAAVEDMVLTDVCPFTMGIDVCHTFGREHVDGYYLPVIHRNTTIPVSREEVVCTVHANQLNMTIEIYQGEARRVKDNLLLGKLKVTGIPSGPAGQSVRVRFTYDLNGILEVEAVVEETAAKFQTVLTQHAEGLTPRQVAAAVEALQALKCYPRDEARNRHLVLFAERVVGEVSPFQREDLEDAINAFEASMASGDRALFESAREGLLTVLSALGYVYEEREA